MFANALEVEFVLSWWARRSLFRWESRGKYRDDTTPTRRAVRVPTDRVWMLSEPATAHQRDKLRETWLPHAASVENLWILDEERAIDLGMPDYDFWIIDDTFVLRLHYSEQYRLSGGEVLINEPTVTQHRSWRDLALSQAVTFQAPA